ncbi:hypothetical protein IKP85_05810 [bacterium]|nr:hypothetical protein [bacterium]
MRKRSLFALFVITSIFMSLCCVGCGIQNRSSKKLPPQSYDEWVKQNGTPPVAAKKTASAPKAKTNNRPQQPTGPLYGQEIPAAIYDNTMPEDKFSGLIRGNKKVVFFSYADCSIGRRYNSEISDILGQNNLYNNYYYMPDLHSNGSSTMVVCKKPGTADCVENFLYQNCSGQVCIINPKQRRVVYVSHEKRDLAEQLISLKDW